MGGEGEPFVRRFELDNLWRNFDWFWNKFDVTWGATLSLSARFFNFPQNDGWTYLWDWKEISASSKFSLVQLIFKTFGPY
jgi:hypothetical protein